MVVVFMYSIRTKISPQCNSLPKMATWLLIYPVKFATGEIHNRLMLKVVTFCNATQSKRYINKKDFKREVWSRVEGYGYQVTDESMLPQLFNSAMACAC